MRPFRSPDRACLKKAWAKLLRRGRLSDARRLSDRPGADPHARREEQVRRATAEVNALFEGAGRALEAYQSAVHARDQAQLLEIVQAERLSDSQSAVRRSRDTVGQWARATYQQGRSPSRC